MSKISLRRLLALGTVAGTAFLFSASPASAYEYTPSEAVILSWRPNGVNSNAQAMDYCRKVGIGTSERQCQVVSFYETKRESVDPNYKRRISERIYSCPGVSGQMSLSTTNARTASFSTGTSVSTSVAVKVEVEPFGVGGDVSTSFTVGQSFDWSWGEWSSVTHTYSINTSPGWVNWIDYAVDHGTARGIVMVRVPAELSSDYPGRMQGGYFEFPEKITGDLPKPSTPDADLLQMKRGYVLDGRPMTAYEKEQCGQEGSDFTIGAPSPQLGKVLGAP